MSFYFGDYIARNIVIRQADIQGLRIGIQAPIKAGRHQRHLRQHARHPDRREQHAQKLLEHLHEHALRRHRRRQRDSAAPRYRAQHPVQQRAGHRPSPRARPTSSGTFTPDQGANQNIIVSDRDRRRSLQRQSERQLRGLRARAGADLCHPVDAAHDHGRRPDQRASLERSRASPSPARSPPARLPAPASSASPARPARCPRCRRPRRRRRRPHAAPAARASAPPP